MFAMFNQLFTAMSVIFEALELFGKSFRNLGKWSELTSQSFVDESAQKLAIQASNAAKELKALK